MRLNDWKADAQRFEHIDRAVIINMAKQEFLKYTRRIRNETKRAYALAYAEFRFSDAPYPDSLDSQLSTMGSQAVRMNAEQIWRKHGCR